jgi:hypothetical protein
MVPPEYRSWGAVPAAWFIDPMMQHLGRSYYVGLLSAAAQHGASHQAAQTFQVVTDRHVEDRDFDRVRLRFQTSALAAQTPIEQINTPTGTMAVSTREATVGDLVEHPGESGGLSNVATILREIGELDGAELARLSALHRGPTLGDSAGCSRSSAAMSRRARCVSSPIPAKAPRYRWQQADPLGELSTRIGASSSTPRSNFMKIGSN